MYSEHGHKGGRRLSVALRGRETPAFRVYAVRQAIHVPREPHHPLPDAHRSEAVRVLGLRQALRHRGTTAAPPDVAHRGPVGRGRGAQDEAPVHGVREMFRQLVGTDDTQPQPFGRETVRVHRLRQAVFPHRPPRPAHPDTQRGKTLPVLAVRQDVRTVGTPPATPQGSLRREGVRVSALQEPVLDVEQSGGAPAHSHRGKTAQVHGVRARFFPVRDSAESHDDAHRSQTVHVYRLQQGVWPHGKPRQTQ